jgi:hypothetical protein
MFWDVPDRFLTARMSMQNWPNLRDYRTNLLNEVASKFVATNAPDPLYWTQNLCFRAFQTVSLLHESGCKTGRTSSTNAQVR